jgi:hypothetical protein
MPNSREAFEARMTADVEEPAEALRRLKNGHYAAWDIHLAWTDWQAACEYQREIDAGVADERAALEREWMDEDHNEYKDAEVYRVAITAAEMIAAAIRGEHG